MMPGGRCPRLSSGQQFVRQGVGHGGGAAGHFELGKDVLDMVLGGAPADTQGLADVGLEAPSASRPNTSSSRGLRAGRAGSAGGASDLPGRYCTGVDRCWVAAQAATSARLRTSSLDIT